MLKKNIKPILQNKKVANSAIEFVTFSLSDNLLPQPNEIESKVLAIQTNRFSPFLNDRKEHSPYNAFNLGFHVGDQPENVAKNRQFLQSLLPTNTQIQWLEQVHGSDVVTVDQLSLKPLIADAAITYKKNICLAVMTADCLPILLSSSDGKEVAAIHGGWRPLASNIITNTIIEMKSKAEDIYAWLGPCIGNNAFEVGKEVFDTFSNQDPVFSKAFKQQSENKYLADLHEIAKIQLTQMGVTHIVSSPECTFNNVEKYYSYRKENKTGRMASLICMNT